MASRTMVFEDLNYDIDLNLLVQSLENIHLSDPSQVPYDLVLIRTVKLNIGSIFAFKYLFSSFGTGLAFNTFNKMT